MGDNQKRFKQVQDVLTSQLTPAMEADGGGLEIVDILSDGTILIRMKGTCLACPSISLTLKGIDHILKTEIKWYKSVERILQ